MDGLFRISEQQIERMQTFFPNSGGVSLVDDPKVLSGIICVQRHGLPSPGCPSRMDPTKPSTTAAAPGREGSLPVALLPVARSTDTEAEGVLMIDATQVRPMAAPPALTRVCRDSA